MFELSPLSADRQALLSQSDHFVEGEGQGVNSPWAGARKIFVTRLEPRDREQPLRPAYRRQAFRHLP